MRLDLYHAETIRLAHEQCALLDEAGRCLATGCGLRPLEQSGMLHALQVLIENAIGKAKHQLKVFDTPVPLSAYDAFAALVARGIIPSEDLPRWNAIIGVRNRIVHDYMNIDMQVIQGIVSQGGYRFVVEFLQQPFRDPASGAD